MGSASGQRPGNIFSRRALHRVGIGVLRREQRLVHGCGCRGRQGPLGLPDESSLEVLTDDLHVRQQAIHRDPDRSEHRGVWFAGVNSVMIARLAPRHPACSTMSAFVLCTKAITVSFSAAGTLNSSSVALTCPRNADQSSSLIPIPLCEVFISRPV